MPCIKHTIEDKKYETWCGKKTQASDWLFQDIDHAVYSIQQKSFIKVCRKCLSEIIKTIKNND